MNKEITLCIMSIAITIFILCAYILSSCGKHEDLV